MADLDTLITWKESTGVRMLTGRKDFINEGVRHSWTRSRMYEGKKVEEFFRHGNRIRDRIFFKAESNFRRIDPVGEDIDYSRSQEGKDWEVPYSIAADHVVFNEFELDLNAANMRPEALAHIFSDVWTQKWMNFYTGLWTKLDDEDWAAPDKSTMEVTTANAKAPYSWAVFVNEYLNGLPDASDQPGGTWTTKMGIAPILSDVDGKWDNQRVTYTYNEASDTDTIFNAMSALYHQCTFDQLPMTPEYSEKKSSPAFIGSSITGIVNFEHSLRSNQEYFRGMASGQDPAYPGPTFMGVPWQRIAKLETAAIYPTAASDNLATELSTANTPSTGSVDSFGAAFNIGFGGPRIYFLNLKYLRCLWHANHYIKLRKGWITPSNRPFERIKLASIMNNNVASSLMRQGILVPSAVTVNSI